MTTPNRRPTTPATTEDIRGVLRSLIELSEIVNARIDDLAARIEALEARK